MYAGTEAACHKLTLTLLMEVEHWSLTTLRETLIKIGAKGSVSGNLEPDCLSAAKATSTMLNESLESFRLTGEVRRVMKN